jgi:hypothetical protein
VPARVSLLLSGSPARRAARCSPDQAAGELTIYPRKGIFIGNGTIHDEPEMMEHTERTSKQKWEKAFERLRGDILRGRFGVSTMLPGRKELQEMYGLLFILGGTHFRIARIPRIQTVSGIIVRRKTAGKPSGPVSTPDFYR